jgi:hypothetical protein
MEGKTLKKTKKTLKMRKDDSGDEDNEEGDILDYTNTLDKKGQVNN